MAENFDVELKVHETSRGTLVEGLPGLIARIGGLAKAGPEWGKETAERAARAGSKAMATSAPEGEDHSDFPLSSPAAMSLMGAKEIPKLKTRMEHDFPARWFPGGAGGGGYWSAAFGVKREPGVRADRDPASLLFHGTGRRGDHLASGSNITPASGNVMTWMEDGRQAFAHSTGGQRANKSWVIAGRAAARGEIARRIAELDLSGRTP